MSEQIPDHSETPEATMPPTGEPGSPQDPYAQEAYQDEMDILNNVMRNAQAEHLMNRCIALAAALKRANDEIQRLTASNTNAESGTGN